MLGGRTTPQTEQSDLQLVDHQLADQVGIDFVERGIATGPRASQRTVVGVRHPTWQATTRAQRVTEHLGV
jgi:hypothetical protein